MAEPPSGTVTFLFTDIEGSTSLWEQHPDAMGVALEQHDAFLRAMLETHGGYVFKTIGDAFCAAFPGASEAMGAAFAIQHYLSRVPPSAKASQATLALKVRVVLDTGAAHLRGGDYFGPTLSRVARLLAVSHGGQILLSQAARDLVANALPKGISLRDLGWHRLRHLLRPEHVYQLLHPDLPADFPALRSLSLLADNLPQRVTRFIGREREIAELKELLATTRLLTLTGAGGTGKTRLAVQVASELPGRYEDGIWLVQLESLTDGVLVLPTVATALQVGEEAEKPLLPALVEFLKEKELLLILDNCEHLIDACAHLADRLLQSCAKVCVLTTSRERLGLPGEQVYRVPTLTVPDLESQPLTPASVVRSDAVQLFLDRVALVQPDFALTPANVLAVAQVCRWLDGIPLAIELAAFRLNAFSVAELVRQMDDLFRLLSGGSRAALPRHQTLRALIDWSYDLLSKPEQALFRRLSVFAGGFTLEAAEAVCADFGFRISPFGGGRSILEDATSAESEGEGAPGRMPLSFPFASSEPVSILPAFSAVERSPHRHPGSEIRPEQMFDLLGHLVDKSLLLAAEGEETRFRMQEIIRQYAWEKLWETEGGAVIRVRHRDWCLAFGEQALTGLDGPDRQLWLRRLVADYENLRAALGRPFPRAPLQPVSIGSDFPVGTARLGRWDRVIEKLVPTYRNLGRTEAARVLLEEYIALCEAEGYWLGLARASTMMAVFLMLHESPRGASEAMYERAIAVCEAHGLDDWVIFPRCRLAELLAREGHDLERAEELILACPPEAEAHRDVPWLLDQEPILARRIFNTLMWIAIHRKDWEGLKRSFQASLPSGGPTAGIQFRAMLDRVEASCPQEGQESIFRDLCDFMAEGFARAGLIPPLRQWYLEPGRPDSLPGELWIEERFETEEWHPALLWQDATGQSRIDRLTRTGWLGVTPAEGTNLWPVTDLNAPRLLAEVPGDFVAQTLVELEPGTGIDAGLLVWGDEEHFARLELRSVAAQPEQRLIRFTACVGGHFQQIGRGLCERPAMWLRFERSGADLVGFCSPDGEEWLLCGRVSLPRKSPERVGMAAIPQHYGGRAWFDTFVLWRKARQSPLRGD